VKLEKPGFQPPWVRRPAGPPAPPGDYTVELTHATADGVEVLAGPESFSVVPAPAANDAAEAPGSDDFRRETADLARRVAGAVQRIEAGRDRVRHLRAGILATPGNPDLLGRLEDANRRLERLGDRLSGDPVRQRLAEPPAASVRSQVERVAHEHWETTGPPTATQRTVLARAAAAFESLAVDLDELIDVDLAALTADLDAAGGPWTPR